MKYLRATWLIGVLIVLPGFLSPGACQGDFKIGLVLSGGGAKGFAHIGVLKVLEEAGVPIHGISGTSMGGIIGALYAVGYTAAELDSLVSRLDWEMLFTDRLERRALEMPQKIWDERYAFSLEFRGGRVHLPSGLIAGQRVVMELNRLTVHVRHIRNFRELPIPFVCVATDLETGEAVVLDTGVLAEALRATMAIPTIFTPVEWEGHLVVDGMLARNLPAQDALALGVDSLICVDVGAPLHQRAELTDLLSILDQTFSFPVVASTRQQQTLCSLIIRPDLEGFDATDFDRLRELIDLGEAAARKHISKLRRWAALAHAPIPRPRPCTPDSLRITEVAVEGLRRVSPRVIHTELNIHPPCLIPLERIERGIERIYRSQYFQRVGYELRPRPDGEALVVRVIEQSSHLARFGLRYDSKTDAALLLNLSLHNLGERGSTLMLDVRLGNELQFDGQYFFHSRFRRQSGLRLRLNFTQTFRDLFQGKRRLARVEVNNLLGEIRAGTLFSTRLAFSLGLRGEITNNHVTIGEAAGVKRFHRLIRWLADLRWDTLDRSQFPTGGVYLQLSGEQVRRELGSTTRFTRLILDWQAYLPITRRLTLFQGVFSGNASGEEIPLHDRFFLGGMDLPIVFLGKAHDHPGLRPYERSGMAAQVLFLGAQYEIFRDRFIQIRGSLSNTFSRWPTKIALNRYLYGVGLSVGMATPIGPARFTIMTGSRHRVLTHLGVGFVF
ncbi:MAG: hypothetical protein D6681_02515 [Calditrichaeota bacterium]|nr:MAG: hypothetical protein D6681_02515 [Calditrichota bacterium]